MKYIQYCLILFCVAASYLVSAQDPSGSQVKIIYSKTIEIKKTDAGFLRQLRGNVEVHVDTTQFFSQKLDLFPNDDIYATDDIVIRQGDSLLIYADTSYYTAATAIAILYGEVAFNDRGRKFFTTELHYDVKHKIAEYDTFGLLTDDIAQFTSYYGTYNVNNDMAFFRDSVELIHPDVVMKTDSMNYDAKRHIAYFLGPTILKQKDALIYCEGGYYDLDNREAFLKYNVQYKEDDKIITADSMKYEGVLNEVTLLGDKSRYRAPDVDASANKMIYNDSTKVASLFHEVIIHSEKEDITGDTVYYNTDTEDYRTVGKTHILSGSRIIDARHAYYDQKSQSNILENNVVVRDSVEGYGILGEKIAYRDSLGLIQTSEGRPLLFFLSEDNADTTFLSADSLVSWEIYTDSFPRDTSRLIKAFYDVKVMNKEYQASCDSLVYNGLDSTINFYFSPVVWADTMQLTGDTITAFFYKETMKELYVREHAMILQHEAGELFNQISGKSLRGHFLNGKLNYIDLIGNIQSVYYVKDDAKAYSSVAEVSSASLRMYYNKGELQNISYYLQPNGTMHPMTINHLNLRLPDFEWLNEKRPTSIEDLKPVFSNGIKYYVKQEAQVKVGD